jgi:hypothetical protein
MRKSKDVWVIGPSHQNLGFTPKMHENKEIFTFFVSTVLLIFKTLKVRWCLARSFA